MTYSSLYCMDMSMNKKQSLIACATINVVFIFAQIYKHTQHATYLYEKQKHETTVAQCTQTIDELTQELHSLKDREHIKHYAATALAMRPLDIKHVKKIPSS